MARVVVQQGPFDAAAEAAALSAGRTDIGALASFVGVCRADGGLSAMVIEHYPGMTERALAGIAAEAERRWPLLGVTVMHRHGRILPGEGIVLVLCAAAHRQAAFEACAFLMDWLKTQAPFWKREEFAEGTARWVEARAEDDAAASSWDEASASRWDEASASRWDEASASRSDEASASRRDAASASPRDNASAPRRGDAAVARR